MSDSAQDSSSQQRYNPSGRVSWKGDGRMDRDWRRCRGRGWRGSFRGRTRSQIGWFKITIPHGTKYDKNWLVPALQDICSIPYTPIQYHEDHNKVHFYVDNFTTASALSKCSRKVTDCDGYKVEVYVNRSNPPNFLFPDLKVEELEHLKQCMSKRFDGSQQALDLKSVHTDPGDERSRLLIRVPSPILNTENLHQSSSLWSNILWF
ncbi:nuclear RNA export factor 1-like [Gouania willdenowi]|uniref:nuclear RNA export factor 1-like n=1 Tax=Gouania willdenowi TaxID=441366 RepID=UPI0010566B16|nr:nuclear RNA export factor 1-like [Gouania willdenowi]